MIRAIAVLPFTICVVSCVIVQLSGVIDVSDDEESIASSSMTIDPYFTVFQGASSDIALPPNPPNVLISLVKERWSSLADLSGSNAIANCLPGHGPIYVIILPVIALTVLASPYIAMLAAIAGALTESSRRQQNRAALLTVRAAVVAYTISFYARSIAQGLVVMITRRMSTPGGTHACDVAELFIRTGVASLEGALGSVVVGQDVTFGAIGGLVYGASTALPVWLYLIKARRSMPLGLPADINQTRALFVLIIVSVYLGAWAALAAAITGRHDNRQSALWMALLGMGSIVTITDAFPEPTP